MKIIVCLYCAFVGKFNKVQCLNRISEYPQEGRLLDVHNFSALWRGLMHTGSIYCWILDCFIVTLFNGLNANHYWSIYETTHETTHSLMVDVIRAIFWRMSGLRFAFLWPGRRPKYSAIAACLELQRSPLLPWFGWHSRTDCSAFWGWNDSGRMLLLLVCFLWVQYDARRPGELALSSLPACNARRWWPCSRPMYETEWMTYGHAAVDYIVYESDTMLPNHHQLHRGQFTGCYSNP